MINVAGVSVPRVLLPEVAERLIHAGFNATASRLLTASSEGGGVVGLTQSERDEILAVLDDPPPGLEELAKCCARSMPLRRRRWRNNARYVRWAPFQRRANPSSATYLNTSTRRVLWADGRPDGHDEIRSRDISHQVTHENSQFELRTLDIRYPQGRSARRTRTK